MSAPTVYQITLPGLNPRTSLPLYVYFECRYSDFDRLIADLNDGVLVVGSVFNTRFAHDEGPDVLEVVSRRPYAISRHGIGRIEPPRKRFVEYEPEIATAVP